MLFNGKTMSVVACFHDDKAVSYAPQALTEEERQQARYNIGVFAETDAVAKLCPDFSASGSVVTCEPLEGYPLTVQADEATMVYRSGKNLCSELEKGLYLDGGGAESAVSGFIRVANYVRVVPRQSYVLSKDGTNLEGYFHGYDANKQWLSRSSNQTIYTVPDGVYFIRWNSARSGHTTNDAIQLEKGITATDYEPYTGEEFTQGKAIPALAGVNTIWADSGDVTVTGKADPVAIMERQDKRIAALEATVTALLEG